VNLFVAAFIGSPAMNLVTAQLTGAGEADGQLAVAFGGYRLAVPASVVVERPALRRYIDHEVVLGVRPSDFEDARLGDPSWGRIPVLTSVTEELGSEVHVIFEVDAPPVEHRDTAAVAQDEGDEEAIPIAAGKSMWTARVSSRSGVRPGERLELAVDTANLHFFDPVSGLAIGQN